MPALPRVDRIKTIYSAAKGLNYAFRFTDFLKQPAYNGVSRYIPQVHRITFRFCKLNEGSVGVRNFVEQRLCKIGEQNPSVVLYAQPVRNTNPVIRAEYGNGRVVQMLATGLSVEDIERDVQLLLSRSGQPIVKLESRQTAAVPSVQGEWNPTTWQPSRMANADLLENEFSVHKTTKQTATEYVLENSEFQTNPKSSA